MVSEGRLGDARSHHADMSENTAWEARAMRSAGGMSCAV